jgi:hypothetical protein
VPLLPMAMTFSRRSMYSHQASWVTSCLFRDGMARKSKVSRLFTAGKRATLILRELSARRNTVVRLPCAHQHDARLFICAMAEYDLDIAVDELKSRGWW